MLAIPVVGRNEEREDEQVEKIGSGSGLVAVMLNSQVLTTSHHPSTHPAAQITFLTFSNRPCPLPGLHPSPQPQSPSPPPPPPPPPPCPSISVTPVLLIPESLFSIPDTEV
ncbi:hypothetical protein Acr_28g0009800 [Actinidia rufa]|uniref:Uncharacterized protein n=1 Tax=Actinidia rufa TaxID=165716 RepID=A0A7J0HBC9_9ERIC|nr:hypothetical protein Acr_28g0009800 [Actinidia rufa]